MEPADDDLLPEVVEHRPLRELCDHPVRETSADTNDDTDVPAVRVAG